MGEYSLDSSVTIINQLEEAPRSTGHMETDIVVRRRIIRNARLEHFMMLWILTGFWIGFLVIACRQAGYHDYSWWSCFIPFWLTIPAIFFMVMVFPWLAGHENLGWIFSLWTIIMLEAGTLITIMFVLPAYLENPSNSHHAYLWAGVLLLIAIILFVHAAWYFFWGTYNEWRFKQEMLSHAYSGVNATDEEGAERKRSKSKRRSKTAVDDA
jgi:hypothetical protein